MSKQYSYEITVLGITLNGSVFVKDDATTEEIEDAIVEVAVENIYIKEE